MNKTASCIYVLLNTNIDLPDYELPIIFLFYFTVCANKKCIVLLILFVGFCHKTCLNYFSVCISTFLISPAHFNKPFLFLKSSFQMK